MLYFQRTSKEDKFMWSKGMLRGTANGDQIGFPQARRKPIKSLPGRIVIYIH